MSLTLAVNTSQSQAQLALFLDEQMLADETWSKAKSHSEVITLALEKLLSKTQKSLSDITDIAVVVGPGSFTGLRVGVNFAKSLAFSYELPCRPINSLRLEVASQELKPGPVAAFMDAQKNSVFMSLFEKAGEKLEPVFENQVVPIAKLSELIQKPTPTCGDGLKNYFNFLEPQLKKFLIEGDVKQANLLHMHKEPVALLNSKNLSWFEVQPFYIKASAPEEKLNPTTFKK